MNPRRLVRAAAAAAALMAGSFPRDGALAQGCAMCGTAAGDAADPLARSLSASTLFLMSMPFLLFFSVAGWLAWRYHRPPEEGATTSVKENPS